MSNVLKSTSDLTRTNVTQSVKSYAFQFFLFYIKRFHCQTLMYKLKCG